jgi:hypothetical protein
VEVAMGVDVRRRLAVGAVAALICLTAFGMLVELIFGPPPRTGSVPLPPANASPGEVVLAYIKCVDVHDRHTARVLLVPAKDGGEATEYMDDVWSTSDGRIAQVKGDSRAGNRVVVQADYIIRPTFDAKYDPGYQPAPMGFTLVRTLPGGRWRIQDVNYFGGW